MHPGIGRQGSMLPLRGRWAASPSPGRTCTPRGTACYWRRCRRLIQSIRCMRLLRHHLRVVEMLEELGELEGGICFSIPRTRLQYNTCERRTLWGSVLSPCQPPALCYSVGCFPSKDYPILSPTDIQHLFAKLSQEQVGTQCVSTPNAFWLLRPTRLASWTANPTPCRTARSSSTCAGPAWS